VLGGDVDVAMSSLIEVKGIVEQLSVLRTLDEQSTALSVSTNFAYWRLGVAYQAFPEVKFYTSGNDGLLIDPCSEGLLIWVQDCSLA
jgi:hypothetical protein